MRGNPFLGDPVHFLRPDLNLEGLAVLPHDGGMQGLIEVGPGDGDVIFDPSRDWFPEVVENPQDRVTVLDAVGDDANRNKIEHFVDVDLLAFHFLVHAIDALDPRFESSSNVMFRQFIRDGALHLYDKLLTDRPPRLDQHNRVLVGLGLKEAESQVFELSSYLRHPESVGQWRVYFEGLHGDALASLRSEVFEGAHVVQAIGQLHEQNANIPDHCQ